MEENNFEKQVQEKMDELKIHPSDSVWKKVEVRIKKKERPNRELFFFLILFCALLTVGYFLWDRSYHPIKKVDNSAKSNNDKNNSDKNDAEKNTAKSSGEGNKSLQAETGLIAGSMKKTSNTSDTNKNADVKKNKNNNSIQENKLLSAKGKSLHIKSAGNTLIAFWGKKKIEGNTVKTLISKSTPAQAEIEVPLADEKNNAEPADSGSQKFEKNILPEPTKKDEVATIKDTTKTAEITHVTKEHSKKYEWNWGILFSGGVSGIGNKLSGLASSSFYYNSPGSNVAGSTQGAIQPSRAKVGFGFMAGLVAQKNISRKMKVVTGINFTSFNTTSKVGVRNDTTGLYDSRNAINTYRTHYNFIALPIALRLQIGKGKVVPFSWQAGLVISELINSNALQFNAGSGNYYSNNSIFNKVQVGFNTDVSVTLFSKQNNPVLIGPYFYYGTSELASEGLYYKKHLIFTGLRTQIIFGK